MRIMKVRLCLAAVLVFCSLQVGASLAADSYTLTTIEYPAAGVWSTFTTGINNRGEIVGRYVAPPTTHALVMGQGAFIELPATNILVTNWSEAYGCNDRGDVVGRFTDHEGITHGYLARGGDYALTILDVPGSDDTRPRDVNESGTVVGFWLKAEDEAYHGFTWNKGEFSEVNYPGAINTYITGINARGDMVGGAEVEGISHSFLFAQGQFTDLNSLFPEIQLGPIGINDVGQIVGTYSDESGTHGLLLSGGTITAIDYPGANPGSTVVWGINSAGQIVGTYGGRYPDGHTARHGFLGQPGNKKKP